MVAQGVILSSNVSSSMIVVSTGDDSTITMDSSTRVNVEYSTVIDQKAFWSALDALAARTN